MIRLIEDTVFIHVYECQIDHQSNGLVLVVVVGPIFTYKKSG